MNMKRGFLYTLMLAFLVLSAPILRGEVIDRIVVVVNGEVITQGEIDRLLGPVYQHYKTMYHGDNLVKKLDEARQAILTQLIEEKVILNEARKQNIEVSEKDIDAKVEEVEKRFNTRDEFERALAEQKISIKELKTRYKDQIMAKKVIDQKVGSTIMITPAEVLEYYNQHAAEFMEPEELKLRNILIRLKEDVEREKTAEQVVEISKKLEEGADFGELAKTYSEGPGAAEGGLMGYVRRGDLLPEIEGVVFNMKTGETSGAIQSAVGYHFFKVEERKDPRALNISEVRRFIEDTIYREKVKGKLKGWIDGLKKNAYIAFK